MSKLERYASNKWSKLMRYSYTVGIITRHLLKELIKSIDAKLGDFLMALSWKRARELARHDRKRQQGAGWFTLDERVIVDALASLIVPSDEAGPGSREAGVVDAIDRLVAGSPQRQAVYARGLLALDERARRGHGRTFVQLTHEQQTNLLRQLDRLHQEWSASTSVMTKMKNRVVILYYKWNGFFSAVELFTRLVQDVLGAFYTSQVCWDWLDYDGPPMPYGYPDLLERRSQLNIRTGDRDLLRGRAPEGDLGHRRSATGKE